MSIITGTLAWFAALFRSPAARVLAEARRYAGSGGGTVDANRRGFWPDAWNAAAADRFPALGVLLGSNYCANALAAWVLSALGADAPPWLSLSPSARVWMVEAQKAGAWVTAEEARRRPELVTAGMFGVWDRSRPGDPTTSWKAHIALVSDPPVALSLGRFESLDGNGPRSPGARRPVLEHVRSLHDPTLLGFGKFT